ncbi:hypothetical protein AXG93_593s1030 [Marchantia polymorpha subsp. ruderalis]|uniref:Uncharacterized protein n=1 Tax=Marchantia polymorpha subsp. ruderalis TaxID=1480154 RepID=A0A176WP96_MARPO|nr:hypothetical protein AXG93_593s1030 [Marchantia polymorpha subsp. ruderalis]
MTLTKVKKEPKHEKRQKLTELSEAFILNSICLCCNELIEVKKEKKTEYDWLLLNEDVNAREKTVKLAGKHRYSRIVLMESEPFGDSSLDLSTNVSCLYQFKSRKPAIYALQNPSGLLTIVCLCAMAHSSLSTAGGSR